ncbi:MAG TPA: pentapeptide repeat-containing protein [Bacteroidales bacterium]|nr:pentapeptide repeat-containing protein [Bacteroidales bacterium]
MIIDCLFKLPINSNNPYINCNANLSHSNLIGTNLDNCNFSNADLSFCLMPSLENVNLKNANISKAKFTLATLHNLDFFNTKIYGTIFQYVQIKDITFENCQTPIVLHFIDSELKNINFENSKINSSSFLSSHLSNVSFKNSEVSDTKFSCSILSKISFLNCDYMYELDFRASGLTEVIFNSYILKAKFNGCDNSYKEYRPLIEDRLKDRIGKIAEVSSINYNTTSFDKCQIGILSQLDVDEIMGFYDELGKSISPRSAKATHK